MVMVTASWWWQSMNWSVPLLLGGGVLSCRVVSWKFSIHRREAAPTEVLPTRRNAGQANSPYAHTYQKTPVLCEVLWLASNMIESWFLPMIQFCECFVVMQIMRVHSYSNNPSIQPMTWENQVQPRRKQLSRQKTVYGGETIRWATPQIISTQWS